MPPFDIPMSRIREKQREQTEVFVQTNTFNTYPIYRSPLKWPGPAVAKVKLMYLMNHMAAYLLCVLYYAKTLTHHVPEIRRVSLFLFIFV